jgi:hypothetical protein
MIKGISVWRVRTSVGAVQQCMSDTEFQHQQSDEHLNRTVCRSLAKYVYKKLWHRLA